MRGRRYGWRCGTKGWPEGAARLPGADATRRTDVSKMRLDTIPAAARCKRAKITETELVSRVEEAMTTKIFVNLAVNDLDRSKAFFKRLGFTLNPQFTDETAACMIIADDIYAMLLTHPKFKEFTKK